MTTRTAEYKKNTAQAVAERYIWPEVCEGVIVTITEIMGRESLMLELNDTEGREASLNMGSCINSAISRMEANISYLRQKLD